MSDNQQPGISSNAEDRAQMYALSFSNAKFMSKVYLWMTIGLLLTGVIAYTLGMSPALPDFIRSDPQRFKFIFISLLIIQFVAVVVLSALIHKMNSILATLIYLIYAALVGVMFSVIFLAYTNESIASTFFITAFSFAGLCFFGYVTKRDLGPLGSFCMIGLFGLIGVMILGLFIPALMGTSVQLATAVIGVVIFAGLTAYDTQAIKNLNIANSSEDEVKKEAIYGALKLYLDFINLFLSLLRLFGRRR
jgi:FtsH-binding integral membrane protein